MCGGRDERDGDAAAEAAAAVVAAVEIEYGSWGAHNEVNNNLVKTLVWSWVSVT